MKIPLPQMPDQVVHTLDRYSDWAAEPTGPTLPLGRWRYLVKRHDWVSIGLLLVLSMGYMWWTGGGGTALGIGVATGILAWIATEAYYHGH